jgi:hypothetical protein
VAVDVAGPRGWELVGDRRDHRDVEQRDALGHLPLPHEHPAPAEGAQRGERRVTEPFPERRDRGGLLGRGVEVDRDEGVLEGEVVPVAVLDALGERIEQLVGPAHPP